MSEERAEYRARPRELRYTPMPPAVAALPVDPATGYPTPFFVPVTNGKADLKLLDAEKQLLCVRARRCAICGEPLGYWVAFITGPQGVKNRVVNDPGMHEDCARYALAVCPYLVRAGARRAAHYRPGAVSAPGAVDARPDRVALYVTRQYRAFSPDGRSLLLRLAPAARIEWFRDGAPEGEVSA